MIKLIKEISKDIVFVTGAKNSAIYNFLTGKVYSLNDEGTQIIKKVIFSPRELTAREREYTEYVKELVRIKTFENTDFPFTKTTRKQINFAWLEVTQKCNNRCIHCYEGQEHNEVKNALSFEQWIDILNQLNALGCSNIQFIGGEPTLYSNLDELIKYAKKAGFKKISIFSNLNALSDRLIQTLAACDVVVRFSVYGMTAETHDKITQVPHSFEKLISNVKKLQKTRVKLQSNVVIMKENEHERDEIKKFLNEMGIEHIKFDEIRKVYGGCQNKHLVQKPLELRSKPSFKTSRNNFEKAAYRNTCWYGKFVISTDGNVFPCEFERNTIYGNLHENTVEEILNSSVLDEFWNLDFSKILYCKDCEFRFACQDCRPIAIAENGNLYESNPKCLYNPYSGKWDRVLYISSL